MANITYSINIFDVNHKGSGVSQSMSSLAFQISDFLEQGLSIGLITTEVFFLVTFVVSIINNKTLTANKTL